MKQTFYKHIDKYHPVDWMLKCVEIERVCDDHWIDTNGMHIRLEFLQILSDIVIRRSTHEKILGHMPSDKEFTDLITLYMNTQSSVQVNLLKKYSLLSLSLISHEQIKFIYPNVHQVARTFIMYEKYEDAILDMTGLKLIEIMQIYLALSALYSDTGRFIFKKEHITIPKVEALKSEKIELFLNYFSKTIKEYRKELKSMRLDKHDLYSFRLLELYPIIKIDDSYIIPTFKNFLQAITTSMYIHLLNHFTKTNTQKTYLDEMGEIFEAYVRSLTSKVFDELIEAKDIVKEGKHAEFIVSIKDVSIVVEVKKVLLKRDTSFNDELNHIDEFVERHLLKAYNQIENTFKYIAGKNKIGIIVLFGDILTSSSFTDYMKKNYHDRGVMFDKNIIIMSIGNYEMLMANSDTKIVDILTRYLSIAEGDRGDIMPNLKSDEYKINPFLEQTYDKQFPAYKETK